MSKYTPLTRHLAKRDLERIAMTFDQIEQLLGFPLPPSSRKHRAWWSNNPSNSVMTKGTSPICVEKEIGPLRPWIT